MHSNRFQLAAPPGLFRPGQPEDSSGGSALARACSSNKHVGMGMFWDYQDPCRGGTSGEGKA